MEVQKRYRITPFVVLKCNTTSGVILTPFYGVKITPNVELYKFNSTLGVFQKPLCLKIAVSVYQFLQLIRIKISCI